MLMIAACGAPPANTGGNSTSPTLPPANNTNEEPTPTREGDTGSPTETGVVGFEAQLTGGGFNNQIVGEGWFVCGDVSDVISNSGLQSIIFISFPVDTTTGTYNFGTGDISTQVQFDAETIYNLNPEGTLTLEAVANAVGEPVRGSFNFTVADAAGDMLTVNGTFDFTASAESGCN